MGEEHMPPVIERVVRPIRRRISVEVPQEFSTFSCRVIVIPLQEVQKRKFDFSDLAGKLQWTGDAVAEQRRLRELSAPVADSRP